MRKHMRTLLISALFAGVPAFAQTSTDAVTTEDARPSPESTLVDASQSASSDTEIAIAPAPVGEADQNYADILSTYAMVTDVGPTRFDYAALASNAADMVKLDTYIQTLAAKTPSTLPRGEAMAYWANLYNALTVQVVVQNYPVKSIRDIKSGWRAGPWKRDLVTVEGETLSLDNIEHDIMRPTFETPLVHYMVNCASIGCPDLKATPWRAATLDTDLALAAREYINSPRGVSVDKGQVTASSIYKWFRKDFGASQAEVLDHFRTYANDRLKAELADADKIDKYKYDWDINAH